MPSVVPPETEQIETVATVMTMVKPRPRDGIAHNANAALLAHLADLGALNSTTEAVAQQLVRDAGGCDEALLFLNKMHQTFNQISASWALAVRAIQKTESLQS